MRSSLDSVTYHDSGERGTRAARWLPVCAATLSLVELSEVWRNRAEVLRGNASALAAAGSISSVEQTALRREAWGYQVAAQRLVSAGSRARSWLLVYLQRRSADPPPSGTLHTVLAAELAIALMAACLSYATPLEAFGNRDGSRNGTSRAHRAGHGR